MIGRTIRLLAGCVPLFAPAFAYAGDWGDSAFQRCWDSNTSKLESSHCLFKELEATRQRMQQLYDDAVRDAEKDDALAFESECRMLNIASHDTEAKDRLRNGPGSHAWQQAKRLRASQHAYQAYLEAEESRINAYIPGNGGANAATEHALNLIQDRIAVLKALK